MPTIYYFLTGLGSPGWLAAVAAVVVPCLVVFLLIQSVSGASTYIERKVAADIQRRVGPNKCNVGAFFGEWARAIARIGSYIRQMETLPAIEPARLPEHIQKTRESLAAVAQLPAAQETLLHLAAAYRQKGTDPADAQGLLFADAGRIADEGVREQAAACVPAIAQALRLKPLHRTAGKLMGTLLGWAAPLFDAVDKVVGRLAPGVLIFLADGIKLLMKEDIVPDPVDKPLFKIAPTIVLASAFGALAVLPYSDAWYVADFNIGIFYIAAITSLEVLGILMAGWASNNKWALLGGMRSAAQIVSYELPVGLAILTGILISGTMSMQGITYDQMGLRPDGTMFNQGWFFQWHLFHPAMFVLAPVYFLAALAECNRTPFDIPEAESELVSGYHTEYSGMRFAFFFMAEYAMMCAASAIAVTLFLGGWSSGIAPLEYMLQKVHAGQLDPATGLVASVPVYYWFGTLFHLLVFGLKTYALVFIMMWIRWTLPRFRVDQMMTLCWKKLIPLSMVCFTAVAVWMLLRMKLVDRIGAEKLETITFAARAVFSFAVLAWLVWFFKKPLTPEQRQQRELLAKANLNAGTAL